MGQIKVLEEIGLTVKKARRAIKDHQHPGCRKAFLFCLKQHAAELFSLGAAHQTAINENETLALERAKLFLLKAIKNTLLLGDDGISHRPKQKKSTSLLKRAYVPAYAFFGTLFSAMGGYLMARCLLTCFGCIANPAILAIGTLFGLLWAGTFVFHGLLGHSKKLTGVSLLRTKALYTLYREQLNELQQIEEWLLLPATACQLSSHEYFHFKPIIKLYQEDMKQKHAALSAIYKPSSFGKAFKKTMGALNAIVFMVEGFVTGHAALALMAAPLLATPVGWMFCGCMALMFLGTSIYFRKKDVFKITDRLFGRPKKLLREQKKMLQQQRYFNEQLQAAMENKIKAENTDHINKRLVELLKSPAIKKGKKTIIVIMKTKKENGGLVLKKPPIQIARNSPQFFFTGKKQKSTIKKPQTNFIVSCKK